MPLVALDFETTGLSPSRHRVVEIGAVLFTSKGKILEEFHTLVNPMCRVGASEIHGIRDSDVLDAPGFAEIIPKLVPLLNGNTVVAHNKAFDLGFLANELQRAHISVSHLDALCTLQLVSFAKPGLPRRLMDCCSALGLPLLEGHHALNDAIMTARLASRLLGEAKTFPLPDPVDISPQRASSILERPLLPRNAVHKVASEGGAFLGSLVARLPTGETANSGQAQYLELLDKIVASRSISKESAQALVDIATRLGMGAKNILEVHRDYFIGLCELARADHYVSDRERSDLEAAALFLEIADWEQYVDKPTNITVWDGTVRVFSRSHEGTTSAIFSKLEAKTDFSQAKINQLLRGRSILLTGEFLGFSREQGQKAITDRGGRATQSLSRQTFALIAGQAAGPSKLEKANSWGVPILDEAEFRELLDTGNLPRRYGRQLRH